MCNVQQHNKVLTGAWSSLLRVEENITTNKLVNSYWWRSVQGAFRAVLPGHNYCISLTQHWIFRMRKCSGSVAENIFPSDWQLGNAWNDYSYEHTHRVIRETASATEEHGLLHLPPEPEVGCNEFLREHKCSPLTKLWQSPQMLVTQMLMIFMLGYS